MPAPGETPFTLPADPKTNGIIIENPHPANPNPGIAHPGSRIDKAHPNPPAASKLPFLTARIGPNLAVTISPKKRIVAIAPENTAYPAAAVPCPAFKTCRKYNAVQSAIAPSERKIQKQIALSASNIRGMLRNGNR